MSKRKVEVTAYYNDDDYSKINYTFIIGDMRLSYYGDKDMFFIASADGEGLEIGEQELEKLLRYYKDENF